MYKRITKGWVKHLDFIILDEICLQIAYILAYFLRQHVFPPYTVRFYRTLSMLLLLFDLLVPIMGDTMHNVLKRRYFVEFTQTLKQCILVFLMAILWLFAVQSSGVASRTVLFLTLIFHIVLSYGVRLLWKKCLSHSGTSERGKTAMLAVLEADVAAKIVERLTSNPLDGYQLTGVVLITNPDNLKEVNGIPVVCPFEEAAKYICREWIDSVFISSKGVNDEIRTFLNHCAEMAVTMHYHVPNIGQDGSKQFVEKIGGTMVLTSSTSSASPTQLILKRALDILGGLVGSLFALIIMAIVGPMIKKASPGPILYKSERIGQNGKRFKMIKIRSMYLDAEARKASLLAQNRVKDGMMFKLEWDPRVIGNEELPDGTRKTGIGEFIRKTSLDEFPQFFNVLKGEMSLVGTRPPTPDEWEKYEYHHRARLATKPGITGMWQVSGRSDITDFEEVVKLDTEYILNWNLGRDIKILLLTVKNVITGKGAM